jgi:hypothetical protein
MREINLGHVTDLFDSSLCSVRLERRHEKTLPDLVCPIKETEKVPPRLRISDNISRGGTQ